MPLLIVGRESAADNVAQAAGRLGVPVFRAHYAPQPEAAAALRGKKVSGLRGHRRPGEILPHARARGRGSRRAQGVRRSPSPHRAGSRGLLEEAEAKNLLLATTQKDFVRLDGDGAIATLRKHMRTLPIRLVFEDEEAFAALANERITRR